MEIAEGLSATLFASEPDLLSPADIDVDARGRVWVCETVNYRAHSGKRPEGDRILILEDTNGDGKSDVTKVYYQGKEVDSAMGICVLGNKVIVSCSPNIWIFTDENGDDKPDRKELLFSKTGDPQQTTQPMPLCSVPMESSIGILATVANKYVMPTVGLFVILPEMK